MTDRAEGGGQTAQKGKKMRLIDILYKIPDDTTVWIGESPDAEDGIYFDIAGDVPVKIARRYEVVSIYPERYPAASCTGISIIVKETAE